MTDPLSFVWLHDAVTWLLTPALAALMLACAIAVIEAGIAVGERFSGLTKLRLSGDVAARVRRLRVIGLNAPFTGSYPANARPDGNHHPPVPALPHSAKATRHNQPAPSPSLWTQPYSGLVVGIGGLIIGKLVRRRWYEEVLERMGMNSAQSPASRANVSVFIQNLMPASMIMMKTRASLVNLVDVMLVFACGPLAALAAGTPKCPKTSWKLISKGRRERPANGITSGEG